MGEFLDQPAFLESVQYLLQGAAVVVLEVERLIEFLQGDWVVSKFKKTKDIVDAEVYGARHKAGPFLGAKGEVASF